MFESICNSHGFRGAIASAAGFLVLLAPLAAHAQFMGANGAVNGGGPPEISAQANIHLQRPATHLRMYLQLTGKGRTLEEAIAALKERRAAAATQIEKLGADKASLVFSDPVVDTTINSQQQRMEALIAQRMGARGGKKPAKPVKPPVAVNSMLTAQWPLSGDSTEKFLLAAETIHEKVKAADLSGNNEPSKLSPEEQEVAEESTAEVTRNYGGDEQQVKPGEPRFVFTAAISEQDREKALAQAFAKAKSQATELAKAAGVRLGPLTKLSGAAGGGSGMSGYSPYNRYNQYAAQEFEFLQQMSQGSGGDEQTNHAMSPKPDGLGIDCTVMATFALDSGTNSK